MILQITTFENIKHINEYHQEYRKARELAKALEYKDFGNFENVITKAKAACKNSGNSISEHFGDITEMIEVGLWSQRNFPSYALSRYACYLIVQNADPSKEIVALGQNYFAVQTRRQELQDQNLEDSKRIYLRQEMKTHNKKLMSTAKEAGVNNYADFNDAGYIGLYGIRVKQIHEVKWLQKKDNLLDHMWSEELAANLFRATQTQSKIKREWIKWQDKASLTHFEVGKKVRKTIQEIGGTMPEKLPIVEDIKKVEKRKKSESKKLY